MNKRAATLPSLTSATCRIAAVTHKMASDGENRPKVRVILALNMILTTIFTQTGCIVSIWVLNGYLADFLIFAPLDPNISFSKFNHNKLGLIGLRISNIPSIRTLDPEIWPLLSAALGKHSCGCPSKIGGFHTFLLFKIS